MKLPQSARKLLESGAHAHLVTLNADGSPQVSVVWAGVDGDEIVTAHLFPQQKLRNIRRDNRVAVSFEGRGQTGIGLMPYLVVYGTATLELGGAPELLQRLARVYLGPNVKFPRMENPPSGTINRIRVERISGAGPWTGRDA
ncbi:MAG: PPOX class F420-dependent oxidoreductase [Candidatus Promineifilaceae bacterium]|nr:PPOX class F420-dependent oxidoreductase [Candidatus Promineifilaceae bacterium]